MVDTDDTRWTMPGVWHKLPTVELKMNLLPFAKVGQSYRSTCTQLAQPRTNLQNKGDKHFHHMCPNL